MPFYWLYEGIFRNGGADFLRAILPIRLPKSSYPILQGRQKYGGQIFTKSTQKSAQKPSIFYQAKVPQNMSLATQK